MLKDRLGGKYKVQCKVLRERFAPVPASSSVETTMKPYIAGSFSWLDHDNADHLVSHVG